MLPLATQADLPFDGATAMVPWNRPERSLRGQPRPRLQWGHGDGAVEWSWGLASSAFFSRLQWGHGDGAVEWAPVAASAT